MNAVRKNIEVKSWHMAVLLILLLGYFYFFNVPPISNSDELLFWGYMHLLLHGFSMILYFRKGNLKSGYPFIALFSFFQLIAFGVPVFVINKSKFLFANVSVDSFEYFFYAYLLFYLTYWFSSLTLFRNIRPFQSMNQVPVKTVRVVLFFFLLLILLNYSKLLPVLSQFAGLIKYVYIGLSLLLIFRKQSKGWEKTVFITVLIIELLSRAVSGLIAEVGFLLLFIVVVMYICSIRMVYLLALIIPFLFFYSAFSKVKGTYRQKVWFSKKGFTLNEKLLLIYDLTQKADQSTKKPDKEGGDNFFLRYSYPSSIFTRVLKRTPAVVPFWEGETYVPLLTKFIPRVLWPDKPKENLGHDFGVRYGIIRESDKVTSINTPVMVEMYVNYGIMGLYLGCAMLGVVFLFIDRYFNSNSISVENKIVNSSITFSLLILEGNFSLMFGNFFLISIMFHYIFKYAKKNL